MGIEAHSIANANEIIAGIEKIYMAQGFREKLAYRKGFESGVKLVIENWSNGKSKEATLSTSEYVIGLLIGENNES